MASTLDTQPDIQVLEAVAAQKQHGLERLESQDIGLDKLERCAYGRCAALSNRVIPPLPSQWFLKTMDPARLDAQWAHRSA